MKKLMVVVAALLFAVGVYAADAAKSATDASKSAADAAKSACADCAKLNKDNKPGDAAKLCPACQKKADDAKAAAAAAKK